MPRFRFQIIDSQGCRRKGILRAESLEIAQAALLSKLCTIEELSLQDEPSPLPMELDLSAEPSLLDKVHLAVNVIASLALFCSLCLWYWRPSEASAPDPSAQMVQFRVSGELDTQQIDGEAVGWKIIALFPEVPFEIATSPQDGGGFSLDVVFEGRPRPGKMLLDVSHQGQRWRLSSDLQVPSRGDLDLGQIVVEEDHKPKSEVVESSILR